MDATDHATIGATLRRMLGTACPANLVSAIATDAIWDRAKRFPLRAAISVELPNVLRIQSSLLMYGLMPIRTTATRFTLATR